MTMIHRDQMRKHGAGWIRMMMLGVMTRIWIWDPSTARRLDQAAHGRQLAGIVGAGVRRGLTASEIASTLLDWPEGRVVRVNCRLRAQALHRIAQPWSGN